MSAKILVVDDEPVNIVLLEELLTGQGHEVIVAADGKQAIESFEYHQPDLVFLDVMMPPPDGLEVCKRLKENPETRLTPVVLVTALSATEDRVRGIEAGADDFLTKPVEKNELLARTRSLLRLKAYTDDLEQAESVLYALARTIEGKDEFTNEHCERLSDYAVRLGMRLKLPPEQIEALRRGGIVHDIGKVSIPEAILLKPGRLTDEEMEIMKTHTIVGYEICQPLRTFKLVLPIIRHHHEKQDGTGYPDGLKGEEIPLNAQILQTVDIYDALSTDRPYHKAIYPDKTFQIMDEEAQKGWRNADLISEFKEVIREIRGH